MLYRIVFLVGFSCPNHCPANSCQFIGKGNRGFVFTAAFDQCRYPDTEGKVKIRLIDKGNLALITPQGKNLRYEGLKAWVSKEGRDLNARLQLKETHCNFKTP